MQKQETRLTPVTGLNSRFWHLSQTRREALWGYFFIFPWLIGLVMFTLGPILAVFAWSFTEFSILGQPEWTGLKNYQQLAQDPLVPKSLANTTFFVLIRVPIFILFALLLALLLNRPGRLIPFFRAAIYLPAMVPLVALAVVWNVLLDPRTGYVNYYGSLIGLPEINWLTSQTLIKPVIVFISLWGIGTGVIIFLAGLQGVPQQLYDAAIIDGANPWQLFRHITLPMLSPTLLYIIVIEVINAFQVFAYAFIVTQGGPANASLFYVLYIYRQAFQFFDMGYASALSAILFLIILVLTAIVMKTSQKWVHYDRI